MRALLGADEAISIPTGVTTTIAGARRDDRPRPRAAATPARPGSRPRRRRRRAQPAPVRRRARRSPSPPPLGVTLSSACSAGHTWLRTGDIALWLDGEGSPLVRFALDERAPRVAAAVLAGAALALSGSLVQATCRNPLAEPGILGITGGAGVGAVIVVTGSVTAAPSNNAVLVGAIVGALVAFAARLRAGLAGRPRRRPAACSIGIGVWYGATALTTYLLVRSNPWDTPRIYTWLSGHDLRPHLGPGAAGRGRAGRRPAARLGRSGASSTCSPSTTTRRAWSASASSGCGSLVLLVAALLAATSVAAVGVVGFVGLVAPHMARALVGGRHARSVPVAVLLGAVLLGVADTGRPHGHRPGPAARRAGRRAHRRAVLRLPAGPLARLTRSALSR